MTAKTRRMPDASEAKLCRLLLERAIESAGSLTALSLKLPAAISHLSLIRHGKASMGPILFFGCLREIDLMQSFTDIIEESHGKKTQIQAKDDSAR